MNERTKTLWLPGFVSLAAASLLLMILLKILFFRISPSYQVTYAYAIWLLLLPLCGAAGAFLSRRANGTTCARLTAGLFPSVVMFSAIFLVVVVDLLITDNGYPLQHPHAVLSDACMWIFAPALASLVGVAPFCRMTKAN